MTAIHQTNVFTIPSTELELEPAREAIKRIFHRNDLS
jgi:hypothetical protein